MLVRDNGDDTQSGHIMDLKRDIISICNILRFPTAFDRAPVPEIAICLLRCHMSETSKARMPIGKVSDLSFIPTLHLQSWLSFDNASLSSLGAVPQLPVF